MKVKDLIAALQLCDQELEVYGYSDHGQTPEKAQRPSIIYLAPNGDSDEYSFEEFDAKEYGYTKQAVVL